MGERPEAEGLTDERPEAEGLMGERPEVEGPRWKVEQLTVAILEQIAHV